MISELYFFISKSIWIFQWSSCQEITYRWESTSDIWGLMLYFLENHDEQRIGSHFFAGDCRKAVPALAIEVLMNTNPVMIYAGQN